MAVLEKIRVKFGILITVLVALALLSFILDPQTLRSAADRFSSDNKVGSMNGKSVSYKTFYEQYNTYNEIAKMMGQDLSSDEAQTKLRNAAWQSIFENEVFIPKAGAAGLSVGEDEMLDLTQGGDISPVLLQQGIFNDQNGAFSREALVNFVQAIDADETGQYGSLWSFLEENIYRERLFSKYTSLLEKSEFLTDLEKSRLLAESNVTSDVDYVFTPIAYADTTVSVTSDEIRKYYKDHKEQYKQPANRDIEYVMWELEPSAQDFADAKEEFDALLEEFKVAENPKDFVTIHSGAARKFTPYYFTEEQLSVTPEFAETAFHQPVGTLSPTVTEDNAYVAMRVNDVRMMADSAHVYYKTYPLSQEADADAFIAAQLRKPDVSEFTELGWATQDGLMSNNMNDLNGVFDNPQKIFKVKPAGSQAFFVLYVPERTKLQKKVQIATLYKLVTPGEDTQRDLMMKAVEFADACDGKLANFEKLVREQDLPVIPINNMVQENRRIGPADNAREVVSWIFDKKTKAGDVSDLKIVDSKYYFVTAVTKARKEGYMDIQEAAPQIQTLLSAKKSVDKKLEEVRAQIAGMTSLEQVAEALGTTVSHAPGISFGSSQYGQNDPIFIGAVAAAPEGTIESVGGQIGVYVFQVMERNTGTFFSDADAATRTARNATYHNNILQRVIANEADIKDNRARFF